MLRTLVAVIGLSALTAGAAQAAACGDEATRLAAQHRLSADAALAQTDKGTATVPPAPPVTVESRGLLGTDQVGAPIEAPAATPPANPAFGPLPPPPGADLRPQPPSRGPDRPAARPEATQALTSEQQRAESLLASAKRADGAGRPQDCQRQLEEAKRLLPPG